MEICRSVRQVEQDVKLLRKVAVALERHGETTLSNALANYIGSLNFDLASLADQLDPGVDDDA